MDEVLRCQACRRTFTALHALSNHQRTCKKGKKRLSGILAKAKEVWTTKRRRLNHDSQDDAAVENINELPNPPHNTLADAHEPEVRSTTDLLGYSPGSCINHTAFKITDQPIATRKAHRPRKLPKRYRDILPEAPPCLPPILPLVSSTRESTLPTLLSNASESPDVGRPPDETLQSEVHPRPSRLLRLIRSPRNIFGLLREFFTDQLPSHDPDELVSLEDLCCTSTPAVSSPDDLRLPSAESPAAQSSSTFYPFPNKSSFLLGHWYWNGGVQKSQKDFKNLLDVITQPDFKSEDVRHTKWGKINDLLATGEGEGGDEQWLDVDAGWSKTQVKISVPFHRRTSNPGPQHYVCADLYHRSLVDIIKERLANPRNFERFHLEPYRLIWKPTNDSPEVHVHGELYTSRAFFDAHCELQRSPGEPGCDLPRVIVALMFWSDSTQLTTFGNTKLWPCYVFFGNESKYRRSKPSCNLCSHAAYFQNVCSSNLLT
jgi:hypothetical protein